MAKKRMTLHTKNVIIKIIDSTLSTVTLLSALQLMSASESGNTFLPCFMVMMFSAASYAFSAFTAHKGQRLLSIRDISFALALSTGAAVMAALTTATDSIAAATAVYFLVLAANRIIAIVRRHRVRSVIVNIILCLLAMLLALTYAGGIVEMMPSASVLMFAFIAGARALGHIIAAWFAEMRLSIIFRIMRKTFAVEILLGLLFMMIVFSFVFMSYEDSMPTFFDALWYCFAVVTTTGFGDITAVTAVGRLLSVLLGIYGIVVVALITSIIVNFYNEVKDQKDDETEETEKAEVSDGSEAPGGEKNG